MPPNAFFSNPFYYYFNKASILLALPGRFERPPLVLETRRLPLTYGSIFWCPRPDSNRHGLLVRRILSPVRLPIPPLRQLAERVGFEPADICTSFDFESDALSLALPSLQKTISTYWNNLPYFFIKYNAEFRFCQYSFHNDKMVSLWGFEPQFLA